MPWREIWPWRVPERVAGGRGGGRRGVELPAGSRLTAGGGVDDRGLTVGM